MKLTLESIRKSTDTALYNKAYKLSLEFDVSKIFVDYNERQNTTRYEYTYDGSIKDCNISLLVDSDDVIIASFCNCPESKNPYYPCKHQVALALAIVFQKKEDHFREEKTVDTFIFNDLFKDEENIEEVFIPNELTIIPKIRINNNNIFLKLSIIIQNKEYIIKDIKNFVQAVLNNEKLKYGKLEITNYIESFDKASLNLIKLLLKTELETKESNKEILLNPYFLEEFFDFYQDKTIIYDEKTKETELKISLKEIELNLELKKDIIKFSYSNILIGFRYFYIINNGVLYKSQYFTNSEEWKLYKFVFDHNKQIFIKDKLDDFIQTIYPIIKKYLLVEDSFEKEHPIKQIRIDTYLDYLAKTINLTYKLYIDDKLYLDDILEEPYLQKIKNKYLFTLKKLGFIDLDNIFLLEKINQIGEFLLKQYKTLKQFGDVYLSKNVENLKIKNNFNYKIKASYHFGFLNLEVKHDFTQKEIENILKNYKTKNNYFIVNDDTIFHIDENTKKFISALNEYNLDVKKLDEKQTKPLFEVLKFANEDLSTLELDEKILQIITEIKNYKSSIQEPPESLKPILRDYQIDAFKWLKVLTKHNFSGILADEMGLGKSLEIISLILSDEIKKPTLIIVPSSLIYNWKNEINKWDKFTIVKTITGTIEERKEKILNISKTNKEIYITSYDLLKRDINLYTQDFRFIIIDEAQFIKNQDTQKAKAVKKLKSEVRFSLTGTPIENSLDDLFSIFDFLMPGYLGEYNSFKIRYENIINENDEESLNSLIKKITPFILRRTKKDCLKELPNKIENIYYCELEEEQRKLYDSYLLKAKQEIQETDNKIQILSYLTRLRQICVHPKLCFDSYKANSSKISLAITLIIEAISSGHKILLFSQFVSAFEYIKNNLNDLNIKYFELTGETKSLRRVELVERFNKEEEVKVFLISLKAGGFGLNLVGADIVIHLDPWWNLAVENQASDRVHRIGQTRNVEIIKIIAADTIEDKVLELQNSKKELFDTIIKDTDEISKLSKDDLKYILS